MLVARTMAQLQDQPLPGGPIHWCDLGHTVRHTGCLVRAQRRSLRSCLLHRPHAAHVVLIDCLLAAPWFMPCWLQVVITVDGYSAPVSAGNFVVNVLDGLYNNK